MLRRFSTFSLVLICGFAAQAAWAADWPRFRGPNGDGISAETGLNKDWKAKPPKELWKIALTDDGYAGPAVAGGRLYILDHSGAKDVVRAVDAQTGVPVWEFPYPESEKNNYGFARTTPLYDAGKLYTLSRSGLAHCLDAQTGKQIWSHDLRGEFHGQTGNWEYAASPVVDGNKLILCPGGEDMPVVALDKADGKTLWIGGHPDKGSYATPVVAAINGKKQYVIFSANAVSGVDAETGRPLWNAPWKTEYDVNAAMPLVFDDSVFITSNYGHGCALLKIAGTEATFVYQSKALQSHFNSPLLYQGSIYGISDKLVCLDPRTGAERWSQPGFEKGGLIAVDGTLIAMDGKGGDVVMAALKPDGYQELGRIKPLGGQSWSSPIIADGRLYVRNKQALVCLDLK